MNDRLLQYAETMKKYRKIRNMSQEDLSKTSGINISTIKKYETGYRNPKYEQLAKIAEALGINVNCFYGNSIKTTGDLISVIASIDEQTDMIITGEKDSYGNYIGDTIKISFKNSNINDMLAKYLSFRENDNLDEDSVAELFVDDSPI